MPREHTIAGATRPAPTPTQPPAPAPAPLLPRLLRAMAGVWLVVGSLAAVYFVIAAGAILAGSVPGRESASALAIVGTTGATALVSWTAGLALLWMAGQASGPASPLASGTSVPTSTPSPRSLHS